MSTAEETVEKKMSELTVEQKKMEETVEKETTEETVEAAEEIVQETTEMETVEKEATQETVEKKRTVTLKSSDDVLFEVEVAVALQSETVKHSLDEEEDGCNEEEDAGKVVPLPIVTSSILAKVIEYCKKHVESSKSEAGATKDALKEWDKDFVNVDLDTLYHLIMAANFMNVKGLLGLTCQRVADIIHGKTPEEIRQTFGIKNDFTPEEEEEIKKQNQWVYCD